MVLAAMEIGQAISTSMLFLVVGTCVLVPMWLRQRLTEKQLDTVTKAMEKGVDPEQVLKHVKFKQRGDINGNWKAGRFLTFVGFIISALVLLAALNNKDLFALWIICMIFPISGIALLMIHKRIVGKVVPYAEQQQLPPNGNGDSAADEMYGQQVNYDYNDQDSSQ